MRRVVLTVLVLLLPSCTSLTPAGAQVRVTENDNVVQGCEYLGSVRASDRLNGGLVGASVAEKNVEKRLQNRAAEKGGDTVLMKVHDAGMSGASARGEVYRCGNRSATPAPTPTPEG